MSRSARSRSSRARRTAPPEPVEVVVGGVAVRVEPDARRPAGRLLTIGRQDASYVDLDDPAHLDWPYVRRIGDVCDLVRAPGAAIDAVHLGGGAATLARYVEATRPRSRQVVVELHEAVVVLAREHLGLRSHPRLRVRVGDAAELLPRRPDRSADLVVCDAFDAEGDIPPALVAPPFAAEVARVLRPGGIAVLNVVDARGAPLARAHAETYAASFAHVGLVVPRAVARGRAGGNALVLASARPLPLDGLRARAASSPDREKVVSFQR